MNEETAREFRRIALQLDRLVYCTGALGKGARKVPLRITSQGHFVALARKLRTLAGGFHCYALRPFTIKLRKSMTVDVLQRYATLALGTLVEIKSASDMHSDQEVLQFTYQMVLKLHEAVLQLIEEKIA